MNKIFIIGLLFCMLSTSVFSQNIVPARFSHDAVHAREGLFLKRIENNMFSGQFNLAGKGDFEKRFFGDFNARIEFFDNPDHNQDASGFRIVKKNLLNILEVKYISNFEDIEKMFEEKLKSAWASRNAVESRKIREEKEKLYNIATRFIPISNQFAEKFYEIMVSFIINFEATEVDDPDIVPVFRGGDPVTFRAVVKAELWSFSIYHTKDGHVRKMANLCREIITDIRVNKFSESKYIYELSTFEK